MLVKALVCERMHWTFTEYDAQPANELSALLEIWNIQESLRQKK
ncbi:MAG: hypothetical protein BWY63_03153 [Chloroflexi bacterium ADurb.Bin360]|jgi:hypothetical protein|nr:MAG: hypothetical protein BWY63_03153 [Chloroflexi bacterium ADurb.Bin360]